MVRKGTMLPLKGIIGWLLLAFGIIYAFPNVLPQAISFIAPYSVVIGIIIAIGGYFHLISGRQL